MAFPEAVETPFLDQIFPNIRHRIRLGSPSQIYKSLW